MFPERSEWKNWNGLEKATYAAQIAAPFSLLVTVVFSFLSWQEARTAQKLTMESLAQERSFFIAQNPPNLELEAGRVLESDLGPLLFLWIRNVGESAAKSPCAEIYKDPADGSEPKLLSSNCNPNDPYADATVRKGEAVTYHIPQRGYLTFRPKQVIIMRPDQPTPTSGFPLCGKAKTEKLIVTIRYKDVLGEPQGSLRSLFLCE